MPLTPTGRNRMLDALRGSPPGATLGIATASLHTAAPGDNGANEVSGGSPAYARKAVSFGAAAAGSMSQSGTDPVFDVPAGVTVTHVGYWSGEGSPVFLGSDPVTNEAFGAQGTYTLTDSVIGLT